MNVSHSANRGIIGINFRVFFDMKVCCVFLLESPHRGDSDEYTQYTIFNMKKEKHPESSKICSYAIFSKGLKNEPSVFEPLKFYCIWIFNRNSELPLAPKLRPLNYKFCVFSFSAVSLLFKWSFNLKISFILDTVENKPHFGII